LTDFPLNGSTDLYDVMHTGTIVVASWDTAADLVLSVHKGGAGSNYLGETITTDDDIITGGGYMVYDGLCYWTRGSRMANATAKTTVHRVDLASISYKNGNPGQDASLPDCEQLVKEISNMFRWARCLGGWR
jgi:hypothetical protein